MSTYMRQKAYSYWRSSTEPRSYAVYMFDREIPQYSAVWSIYAAM